MRYEAKLVIAGSLGLALASCAGSDQNQKPCLIDSDCNDPTMQCVYDNATAAQGYCAPGSNDGGTTPRTDGGPSRSSSS